MDRRLPGLYGLGVNPATGALVAQVRGTPLVHPVSLIALAGSLWVLDDHNMLRHVDPASGSVVASYELPDTNRVVFGDGSLWLSSAQH